MQLTANRRQEWKLQRQAIIAEMIRLSRGGPSGQLKILWAELRECERKLLATCTGKTENWYEAKELLELDKGRNPSAMWDTDSSLSIPPTNGEKLGEMIGALMEREKIDPCDFPSLEANSPPIKVALRAIDSG